MRIIIIKEGKTQIERKVKDEESLFYVHLERKKDIHKRRYFKVVL